MLIPPCMVLNLATSCHGRQVSRDPRPLVNGVMNMAFVPPTLLPVHPVRTAVPPNSAERSRARPNCVTPRHAFAPKPATRTASQRHEPAPITRSTPPSSVWVEHAASVVIEGMTPTECFDCYSDLEAMPKWSPWLKTVQVDPVNPAISRWTIATRGLEVSWKARNTAVKRGELISWVSETGLANRGRVKFEQCRNNSCRVTLAIEFDIPAAAARAVDNEYIGQYVVSTLSADLKRFRKVVLHYRRKSIIDSS